MESPASIYIINSELPSQQGKLTGLNLCEIINDIVPGQPIGSQHYNGVWTISLRSTKARDHLDALKYIEYDNVRIELFANYPTSKPVPNEKIIFKDLPFWVKDQEILDFLGTKEGITVKSGVISARLRDRNNQLTQFYSGDRFVFVKGNFSPALHPTALIDYNTSRVWHKSQELMCRRCRHTGHVYTNTEACKAYCEDPDVITIRSPNYVLCNYFLCPMKIYETEFNSSEHAYQWRFLKFLGMDDLANEILDAQSAGDAKVIASRVPRHLHKDWHTIKTTIMKEILHAKADYCSKFKDELLRSAGKRLVESTRDLFWSSGLSPRDSETTHKSYYPGMNQLGSVLEQVRSDLMYEAVLTSAVDIDTHNDLLFTDVPLPGSYNPHVPPPQILSSDSPSVNSVQIDIVTTEAAPSTPNDTSTDILLQNNESSNFETHSIPEYSDNSSNEESEITMSGIEELLDKTRSTSASDSESNTNNICVVSTENLDTPTPQQGNVIKETVDKEQSNVSVLTEDGKRKMTPGKDADTARNNVKIHRSDIDKA